MTKRFNQGDIVYWCRQEGHTYTVEFGMVDEQFSDAVYVDLLALRENRFINGVLVTDFQSETKYKKLPKDWTYNTVLWKETYDESLVADAKGKLISNPQDVKDLYDKGVLVKSSTKFHGEIEAEITNDGYRIVKKHPMWRKPIITHTSIRPDRLYYTYDEALQEVITHQEELKRQASLSDLEWSIEQIDKVLRRSMLSKDDAAKYREWLLSMSNVEDIEVRLFGGDIQWKYEKNKKWNSIEL